MFLETCNADMLAGGAGTRVSPDSMLVAESSGHLESLRMLLDMVRALLPHVVHPASHRVDPHLTPNVVPM